MLSDAEKRKIYDRYGEEGLKQHEGGGGRGGGPQDIFAQCVPLRLLWKMVPSSRGAAA